MDGRTLGRREFLIGATAGAGLLLHRVPAVGAQSTRARVRSVALTPGPGVRAYVQQTSRHFPGEILLAHNHKDARFFELYRVDVATGGSTLVQANDRFRSFVTDRQFRVRLGAAQTDDGGVDYFQRDAGGEWKPFTQIDMTDA